MNGNLLRGLPCLFLLLLFPAFVQATDVVTLGYCPEAIPEEVLATSVGSGEARISAAICLPRETMMRYRGGRVTKIRFGVKAGYTGVSVWLRQRLDERSVVVQSVKELQDGWNEVELTKPLSVDGEALYVGFTAQQTAGFQGILHSGEGSSNSSWLADGNSWRDYHIYGVGTLFIQAVVEADIPAADLGLITLKVPSLVVDGAKSFDVECEAENLGRQDVKGFTAVCQLDGVEALRRDFDVTLKEGEVFRFQMNPPTIVQTTGRHNLQVRLEPKGMADERADNDSREATFFLYNAASVRPRMVLLEHFTSIPCVNCPPTDELLERVVGRRDDVVWTSHHVGYRDDELTLEDSRPLTAFGIVGNPEILIDRATLSGTSVAIAPNGLTEAQVGALFDAAASRPAFAALHPAIHLEGSTLRLGVEGETADFFTELYPQSRLHVFLVEDSVEALVGQAGNPTKHVHDNIVRAIPTGTGGMAAEWSNGNLNESFEVPLDEAWLPRHLRVVAFLTLPAMRGSGQPSGEVLCAAQEWLQNPTGIETPSTGTRRRLQYYDLQGRRMEQEPAKGVYIFNRKRMIK